MNPNFKYGGRRGLRRQIESTWMRLVANDNQEWREYLAASRAQKVGLTPPKPCVEWRPAAISPLPDLVNRIDRRPLRRRR